MNKIILLFISLFVFSASSFAESHENVSTNTRPSLSSEEEVRATLAAVQRILVANRLARIQKNRSLSPVARKKAIEKLLAEHDTEIDGWLAKQLDGKKLFPCELPDDLSKSPKIVFHGDTHGEETEYQQKLIDRSSSTNPNEKIRLLVEAAVHGDKDSVDSWASHRKFKNVEFPNVQGLERADSLLLAFWVDRVMEGAGKDQDAEDGQGAVLARVDALEALMFQHDLRKALPAVLGELPQSHVRDLIARIVKLEQASPEKAFDKLRPHIEKRDVQDEAGWETFSKVFLDYLYSKQYGKEQLDKDGEKLVSLLRNGRAIENLEFYLGAVGERRSVDWVVNIAKEYCEALKTGTPLYVTVGLYHVPTMQRLLRSAVPTLRIETELVKGSRLNTERELRDLLNRAGLP